MKDLLICTFLILFTTVLKILPLKYCKKMALTLGTLIYHLARGRNKVVRKNIKKAFPSYSAEQCESLLKKVYQNFSMVFVEVMLLEQLSIDELKECIAVEGEEYLQQVQSEEKGLILYTAHFGNWEWLGTYFSAQGNPVSAIVKKQSNSYFNKKINEIRRSKGAKITTKDLSLRKIYRRLLKGEILYILGDQDGGKHGWATDFFGRETSTFNGPVRFAVGTGANILPVFFIREDWLKHRLVYYPPYKINKNASEDEQRELLQELTTLTETVIREFPEQWFWLHRRWKSKG